MVRVGNVAIVHKPLGICSVLTDGCEVEVTVSRFSKKYFGEVNEQAVYICKCTTEVIYSKGHHLNHQKSEEPTLRGK